MHDDHLPPPHTGTEVDTKVWIGAESWSLRVTDTRIEADACV